MALPPPIARAARFAGADPPHPRSLFFPSVLLSFLSFPLPRGSSLMYSPDPSSGSSSGGGGGNSGTGGGGAAGRGPGAERGAGSYRRRGGKFARAAPKAEGRPENRHLSA